VACNQLTFEGNSRVLRQARLIRQTQASLDFSRLICRAGDRSAAALFVLMGTLEHSAHPKLLANTVKHFAFTRCGELNLFGMVDAQVAVVEDELLADETLIS